jgi:hypothetical protein
MVNRYRKWWAGIGNGEQLLEMMKPAELPLLNI